MKKKLLLVSFAALLMSQGVMAQRVVDKIDRGLVAMKVSGGVYCSWRIFGEEYYDVKYNLYRDGVKVNSEPLNVSNYTDASGSTGSTYTVAPVIKGVEQSQCSAVSVWENNYLDIPLEKVYDDSGNDITSWYEPNDVSVADVNGDGIQEILLKRRFTGNSSYSWNATDCPYYDRLEVYTIAGKRLWYIDCGKNMLSLSSVETNIFGYDWDQDGKAEVLLRGADGMVIHKADGSTQTIGDASKNYRNGGEYMADGAEFLLYLNGETGEPYVVMDYPLARGNVSDWGDSYGHRATKHYFGAPYFDGRKPSIYLGRGCYTQHKMVAYDVDPSTHALTQRWYWECTSSSSPYYGQGYHNFSIADVDWDGRDEIVHGSMVIDDNGKGLSTTGLGHGDAMHVGDFDPYSHGQEVYACNETSPCNNFRDATTSKIYYRIVGTNDDGRAIMGNFSNEYPGAIGCSARDGWMSSVTHKTLGQSGGIDQNFRCYWDGDLLEETFNYSGFNTSSYVETGNPRINKLGSSIFSFADSKTCNGTKGTPSFMGDILGDWREEFILRTDDGNLRLFTTNSPTAWRVYTLWHDHQYRNGMYWEMTGYNQPPHVSYFLGEMEGITTPPPPLVMTGRTEVANGGTISSSLNDQHAIVCETNDTKITVEDGAQPWVMTFNVPSWVQGKNSTSTTDPSIGYTYYTCTVSGGAFAGSTRLVKQGDGILVLPAVTETYSGSTDVWAGTLQFDGTMQNSRVWLNRFAVLTSAGGTFSKGIEMDYASELNIGADTTAASQITTDSLILNFGAKVNIDILSDGSADQVKANVIKIEKKNWKYGPAYLAPVFNFNGTIGEGTYLLGEVGAIDGDISNIILAGLGTAKGTLSYTDGKLYLTVQGFKSEPVRWIGKSITWNTDDVVNFVSVATGDTVKFVPNDSVYVTDDATMSIMKVSGTVTPAYLEYSNVNKSYTLQGDSLCGDFDFVKTGAGNVTIKNLNHIASASIDEGMVTVSNLANAQGDDYGALGKASSKITLTNGGTLATASNTSLYTSQGIRVGAGEGGIEVGKGATLYLQSAITGTNGGTTITKSGAGTLNLQKAIGVKKLVVKAGTVDCGIDNALPATVEFQGGTVYDHNSENSNNTTSSNFVVDSAKTGTLYLDPRCVYSGKLTGSGRFTVYAAGVRNYLQGDWSAFTGTVVPATKKRGTYDPTFTFKNTYGIPNAVLLLNSGITVSNEGYNFPVGMVSGSGTLSGSGTYTLMMDTTYTFLASTASGTPLVKKGSGTITLSTPGKLLGSLEVNEGTLQFYDTSLSSFFTSATMKITGEGNVIGCGYVNSNVMSGNGVLSVYNYNDASTPGTFKTRTIFTEGASNTINMLLAANGSNSLLEAGTTLTLNGTVNFTLADGYTPAAGDTFKVWTAATFAGEPTLSLPELPLGLAWDTTDLLTTNGVLRVVEDAAGIAGIDASTIVKAAVYNVSGYKVADYNGKLSQLSATLRRQGLPAGQYLIRLSNGKATSIIIK